MAPKPSNKLRVRDILLIIVILMPPFFVYFATHGNDGGGKVGTPIDHAGVTYEVVSATTKHSIGDPSSIGATAKGTFVVVKVKITNFKDRSKSFDVATARFRTKGGTEYRSSGDALLALGSKGIVLKQLQPTRPVKGTIVFDVPKDKVADGTLVIGSAGDRHGVSIDLGL